jgi:hypothetical protein
MVNACVWAIKILHGQLNFVLYLPDGLVVKIVKLKDWVWVLRILISSQILREILATSFTDQSDINVQYSGITTLLGMLSNRPVRFKRSISRSNYLVWNVVYNIKEPLPCLECPLHRHCPPSLRLVPANEVPA